MKAEIAVLEEQLMAYANAPTPGPRWTLWPARRLRRRRRQRSRSSRRLGRGLGFRQVRLRLRRRHRLSRRPGRHQGLQGLRRRRGRHEGCGRASAETGGPGGVRASRAARARRRRRRRRRSPAAARASAVRDALQRVIVERVSKMEAFSSLNVEKHRLEHVAWLLRDGNRVASPMVFVCVRVGARFRGGRVKSDAAPCPVASPRIACPCARPRRRRRPRLRRAHARARAGPSGARRERWLRSA